MRSPTGTRDCALSWPANTVLPVSVPVSNLPAGTTLAAWETFTLTLREDPCFPRQGAALYAQVDPFSEGWQIVATFAGTPNTDPNNPTLTFTVTVPQYAGRNRYVVDVRAYGSPGETPFYEATWLSVTPSGGAT